MTPAVHDSNVARIDAPQDISRALARTFVAEYHELVSDLRAALDHHDQQRLAQIAQSVQQSAAFFTASIAVAAARRLQRIARCGDFGHAEAACATLEFELAHMCRTLSAYD